MSRWDWVRAAVVLAASPVVGLIIGTLGLLTLLTIL